MVFEHDPKPRAKAIKSPMGGGWIVPLDDTGGNALAQYFGEPAAPIGPLGGELGWIVEPADAADLAEYLKGEDISWEVE